MIKAILFWLSGFLPLRVINDGNRPYLERYYLCTVLGWRFYLHRFVGSDPDRGLHDHPWSKAYSLILSGWYWEETRCGMRKVRWFNSLTGDSFHRVVLPCASTPDRDWFLRAVCPDRIRDVPCWTLFFHRVGDAKDWGFLRESATPGQFVYRVHDYGMGGKNSEWWKTAPRRGNRA